MFAYYGIARGDPVAGAALKSNEVAAAQRQEEMFYTLQGQGANAGRPCSVDLRDAICGPGVKRIGQPRSAVFVIPISSEQTARAAASSQVQRRWP
jgi:hypothetical protein